MAKNMVPKQLNNLRYEKKYILPQFLKEKYLSILNDSKNIFIQSYEPRLVQSIYYDTSNLFLAKQNLEGESVRYKLRMRFYDKFDPKYIFLEIKYRNYQIGNKAILKIDNKNCLIHKNILNLKEFRDFFSKFDIFSFNIEQFIPILFVTYKRYYFTGLDKRIRITFDENICYQNLLENNLKYERNSIFQVIDNNCILEIKYPTDQELEIKPIISKLDLRVQRNSKYINGLEFMNLIWLNYSYNKNFYINIIFVIESQ